MFVNFPHLPQTPPKKTQTERLHEYAALRLINVLTTVLRRFTQLHDKLSSSSFPNPQHRDAGTTAAATAASLRPFPRMAQGGPS